MSVTDSLLWLQAWLLDRTNRVYLFLFAYLAGIASLLSFSYFNSGIGQPSRLQFALIAVAMILSFILALDSGER